MGLNSETFFKKLLNSKFLKGVNKINKRLVAVVGLCVTSFVVCVVVCGIRPGFNVNYEGKKIATVSNVGVCTSAKGIAIDNIYGENAEKAIESPKLTLTFTVKEKLVCEQELAEAIIANTDSVVKGAALMVNGEMKGCAEYSQLSDLVENKRTAYYISGAKNEASFIDSVELREGYYLKSDISEAETLSNVVEGLQVKTLSTVVTDVSVAFSTKQVKTNSQSVGYYKVTTAGKNGTNCKTELIENINGTETSCTLISNEVVTKPVTQVVTIGTAPVKVSATEKANISSAGLICPITKGKYTVSSYYGDGRGHKAVDLAAKRGTAIFAAASGTVVSAGWDGDYGYSVLIDHGNGMKTRYAHASALCVSKGQTVSQGDQIAKVGSTGYSTGNHLHFEVIINGVRVNPAPYVGL